MRIYVTANCWLVTSPMLLAQSDRGNITGTVSDPAGAVVAGASVEARNTDTGATSPVATSATGNYTIAELAAGTYELSVTSAGFKRFIRPGLIVQAAQTIRVDAALEVGSASESVTINAEAALLKTESGELSNTSGATYYPDFRGERRPVENFGIGRLFHIRESVTLNLRAEFTNIFNRTYLNNPATTTPGTSPQTPPVCKLPSGGNGPCSAGEQVVSGFGAINTSTVMFPQRTGQLGAIRVLKLGMVRS